MLYDKFDLCFPWLHFSPDPVYGDHELRVINNIWKSPTPTNVIAFSWKLLQNGLPTRANLVYWGIEVAGGTAGCVHCQGPIETETHLFLFCDFAIQVWKENFRRLGLVIIIPPNLFVLLDCFTVEATSKKVRIGYYLIWHATVRSIWSFRNNCIF
jgi:hypothetical protein